MRKLALFGGGPAGTGKTIDLDHICNGNDTFCPEHGFKFSHPSPEELKRNIPFYEEHKYSAITGEYLGKKS